MRKNKPTNHRKTGIGATGPAAGIESPDHTAEQRERMQAGLRILARIIARSHLRRQAARAALEPPPDRRAGD